MSSKRSLAGIEGWLTPQQIVLAYLAEMFGRFESYRRWADHVIQNPTEAPIVKLRAAVREAASSKTSGRRKDQAAGLEEAVREAVFLVELFMNVAGYLAEKVADYELQAAFCARSLQVLCLEDAMEGAVSRQMEALGAKTTAPCPVDRGNRPTTLL